MGCFDSVFVPCPKCGERAEFQSKGGDCTMSCYELGEAPYDVMLDVNRHSPCECSKCGTKFAVGIRGNLFASMTDAEIEESATKVTNRDSMAAMMRSAITGSVIDVARRFGLGDDFKPVAEALSEEALKAIYEISAEEIDKKSANYQAEISRMMEERNKSMNEMLEGIKKAKEEGEKKKESGDPKP